MRDATKESLDCLCEVKGSITLAFSHQAEDVVVLDLLLKHYPRSFEVFTLETGKLFTQTLAFHEEVERFFNLTIQKYHPSPKALLELERELGEWGMRESLENRHRCCRVRKIEPLKEALKGKSAWVTGLRAEQSITRAELKSVEFDETFDLLKFNPLSTWSETEVFEYIKEHALPLHPLYAEGYRSIGCSPCTRAIEAGEELRAGRWWWENPEHKECGLHLKGAQWTN